MAGKLSTHVLDTANGKPAAGMRIDLFRIGGEAPVMIASVVTNGDGRTDAPLLEGEMLRADVYQLLFYVGDYYKAQGHGDGGKFLTHVPVVFTVADAGGKYHVPLLVSPWGYSTYRGS